MVASWPFACATAPVKPRGLNPQALLAEGDALVARGCYRCLQKAVGVFEQALGAGVSNDDAIKVPETWLLIAARERETGLRPSDALDRAKRASAQSSIASNPATAEYLNAAIRLVEGLPFRTDAASKEATATAARALFRPPADRPDAVDPSLELVRARGGERIVAQYLDVTLSCATARPVHGLDPTTLGPLPPSVASLPLFRFRAAICGRGPLEGSEENVLREILRKDPEFHEAHLYLGIRALASRRALAAEKELLEAANGLPESVSAWALLGQTRRLIEEYDESVGDFTRALSLEPLQREALLGRAQSLAYAGRFEEAAADARKLVDLGTWFISDASYWLALAEYQLGRIEDAAGNAAYAKRTNPMNGDVARLVGLIAERQGEDEFAKTQFELAVSRNSGDCEAHQHLGLVHGRGSRYQESVASFLRARNCYAAADAALDARITEIEASTLSPFRKQAALARVSNRRKGFREMQATASLGAAEGEAQRGAIEAALAHLDAAAQEPALADRVADLRNRLRTNRRP